MLVPGLELSSIPPCKVECRGREKNNLPPLGGAEKVGLGCGSFLATI